MSSACDKKPLLISGTVSTNVDYGRKIHPKSLSFTFQSMSHRVALGVDNDIEVWMEDDVTRILPIPPYNGDLDFDKEVKICNRIEKV